MDHLQINKAFRDFYAQLYTSECQADNNDNPDFVNDLSIACVSPDLKKKLEEPISQAEIVFAISSIQSGNCPGPDGFPAEFFNSSPHFFLHCYAWFFQNLICKVFSIRHLLRLASLLQLKRIKTQLTVPPTGLSHS